MPSTVLGSEATALNKTGVYLFDGVFYLFLPVRVSRGRRDGKRWNYCLPGLHSLCSFKILFPSRDVFQSRFSGTPISMGYKERSDFQKVVKS